MDVVGIAALAGVIAALSPAAAPAPSFPSRPIRILVPAGTPAPLLERLHAAIVRIMQRSDVRERFVGLGAGLVQTTPDEFAARVKSGIGRRANVVRDSGVGFD